MKKGVIIGAGIGGLSTAIALAQKGIEVTIYEQAPELKEVGAGIWVAPNGLKVYEKLGIVDEIIKAGQSLELISAVDINGKVISTINSSRVRKTHKYSTVAIHRGVLHKKLVSYIDPAKIILNKSFKSYKQTANSVIAEFQDGTSVEADFLIVADGIKSKARMQMQSSLNLRYSGQTCWRFVTNFNLPKEELGKMSEIWADEKGLRAAYSKINDEQTYCYITNFQDAGGKDNKETLKADLLKLCANFNSQVKELINSCNVDDIIRSDLFDFKPIKKWTDGRVVLIGDAAHATTPNLGQGACQAIEDAYVIANELATIDSIEDAFKSFQNKRIKKATSITNTSYQFAQMTNTTGFKKRFVKMILRLTPDSINDKQIDKIYNIE